MPGNRYAELSQELLAAGIGAEIPCVVISSATTKHETIFCTAVGKLAECPTAASPSLLIVGSVVASAIDESDRGEDLSSELYPELLGLALLHPSYDS